MPITEQAGLPLLQYNLGSNSTGCPIIDIFTAMGEANRHFASIALYVSRRNIFGVVLPVRLRAVVPDLEDRHQGRGPC